MALYCSLKKHCPCFKLWILCLSHKCYEILSQINLDSVYLIRLEEIEEGDNELLRAKENRSLVEYYFTLTPSLPLYILNHFSEVGLITYLDSDLYFFSDPKPIFDEIGTNSIAIIAHRFSPRLRHLEKVGVYNLGWVSFRRDKNGLGCLQWYRERCNEWCYDRVEGDRYADQKYLDRFEELFDKVYVIQHKGANLAPWNIDNYKISERDKQIWVDDQRLIFFHFHGLKNIFGPLYDSGLGGYGAALPRLVRNNVYKPYLRALRKAEICLPKVAIKKSNSIRGRSRFESFQRMFPWLFEALRRCKRVPKMVYSKTYVISLRREA